MSRILYKRIRDPRNPNRVLTLSFERNPSDPEGSWLVGWAVCAPLERLPSVSSRAYEAARVYFGINPGDTFLRKRGNQIADGRREKHPVVLPRDGKQWITDAFVSYFADKSDITKDQLILVNMAKALSELSHEEMLSSGLV